MRYLLSHEAGLPALRKSLPLEALFDWHAMTSALAEIGEFARPRFLQMKPAMCSTLGDGKSGPRSPSRGAASARSRRPT